MSKPAAIEEKGQVLFSFAAPQVLSMGDGSFRIIPGKPVSEMSVKQAAARLGVDPRTMRRIFEAGHVTGRRPTRRKIILNAQSVEAYHMATSDPEFWAGKKL